RVTILAQALSLSVADFLRLRALSGANPFDASAPTGTLAFVQMANSVTRSSFSLDELDYLLCDQAMVGSAVAPLDQNVALLMDDIYTQLVKIPDPTPNPDDPTGELTLAALSKLTAFTTSLVNQAMAIVSGSSTDPAAVQNAFIDANFSGFIDPT